MGFMRKCASAAVLLGLSILLLGCAAIFEGKSQQISIYTNPTGADCGLYRQSLRIGTVQNTPGSTVIEKNKYDIWIVCVKEGYQQGTYYNHSGVAGATVADVLGGVVTGGIAWGIDSASGADNKYDGVVNVTLFPNQPGQANGPSSLPQSYTGTVPLPTSPQTTNKMGTNHIAADTEPRRTSGRTSTAPEPIRSLDPGSWVCGINNYGNTTNPNYTIEFSIAEDHSITVASYGNAPATITSNAPLTFTALNPRGSRVITFTLRADNSMIVTGPNTNNPDTHFYNAGNCVKT